MKNISNILELCEKSFETANSRAKEFILRNSRKIDLVLNLFSDEESNYLYAQEIIYCALSQVLRQDLAPYFAGLMTSLEFSKYVDSMRNHKIFNLLKAPKGEISDNIKACDLTATFLLEQYSYKDLVRIVEGDICLDCGAYIGDTALYFSESKPKKIYSFEIDCENLKCLKDNIINFGRTDVVEILQTALGRKCGTMSFVPMQGNSSGGHITEKSDELGAYDVNVTTIDAFCEEQKIIPNFIKMDIEGAELDAIYGACKTIKKYKPKLAVCIYHKLEHHWEIPLLLHELCAEYKLYFKKSQPYTEAVLFAAP
ncbi:MAG: FkbM family methyltransferase [Desulfovibrionaceae bacterium]|nr:FkbM family methyltransferase [Desulfovibrionaceae bacterium]